MHLNDHIFDVAIAGGGLAGLSAAIELARQGRNVVLFEKKDFPRHKVCGEYVSNEVLPVLATYGIDPFEAGATRITRFELSAPSGRTVSSSLPLGAFGLSRFCLDEMMASQAQRLGVHVHAHAKVHHCSFEGGIFSLRVNDQTVRARFVVGAIGKNGNLNQDTALPKKNTEKYVAVKRHVQLDFPNDLVALHNFNGGYCGVSQIEGGKVNLCYLAQASDLKRAGSIVQFEKEVLYQNPHLKRIFTRSKSLFPRPITVSNFSFGARKAVSDHILYAGDAAGMISPLCGNGMAMAILSGYRLGQLISAACDGRISRTTLEQQYSREWKNRFSSRLWWGNRLQSLFGRPFIANTTLLGLQFFPAVTPAVIKQTHGKAQMGELSAT